MIHQNVKSVCFFGTYDKYYSRNQVIFAGLDESKFPYSEVHLQLVQTKFYSKGDVGVSQILYRLYRKLSFVPIVLSNISKIRHCDVLFVPYPGHLDIPLAWMMGFIFRKPVVFDPTFSLFQIITSDFHLVGQNNIKANVIKIYERIIFSLPDIVIADSPFQKEYYRKTLGVKAEKIKIIPFGVNNAKYPYIGYAKEDHRNFIVIYYGLYNPIHGVEYIVECANLLRHIKKIQFLFIGDGQDYEKIHNQVKRLGLSNITFYRDVTEKDALPLLEKADVFMGFFKNTPTATRTIPNKVLQGLSLGKAVVSADTPAMRSVFNHKKSIYLCRIADPNSLAAAIKTLALNSRLKRQIGLEGHRLSEAHFTPKRIAQKFEHIVKKV